MVKKKNWIEKIWLKYTDRNQYKQYKWEVKNYQLEEYSNYLTGANRLNTLQKIREFALLNTELNINHSGNAGDIIYALATLKKIHELTGIGINLYLKTGQERIMPGHMSHPLGNVMLNEKMVNMLSALINTQGYINKCEAYNGQTIHIDLDIFRTRIIPLENSNIARWYSYLTGVTPTLSQKWINVEPDKTYQNKIVLARSGRYRNSAIDYSFLKQYDNLIFIGVKDEYEDMRQAIPNLEWVQVPDFLKLAQLIAASKFFIGNQSFPFSIAEGLKVPRVLEAYFDSANVIPEGENAYDFYFQEHFESIVEELAK